MINAPDNFTRHTVPNMTAFPTGKLWNGSLIRVSWRFFDAIGDMGCRDMLTKPETTGEFGR